MRVQFLRLLAVAVALISSGVSAWAAGEEVKFDTADKVDIHGTYYPSNKGKKAFTVLMLHAIGPKQSSTSDDWSKLAEELQKAGCAVLTFDFRGHGKSTTVDKDFWAFPENQRGVTGFSPTKPKDSILQTDFRPNYTPVLVNDIMAAKQYLDRRNDAGECNSGKLIILGAGEGATLGLLWAYSEYSRFKALPGFPIRFETKPEGKDLAGFIGLSMSSSLGSNRSAPVATWLKQIGVEEKVPVAFVFGSEDPSSKTLALGWLKNTLKVDTTKNEPTDRDRPNTWYLAVTTKLSGQALVSEKLPTINRLVGYVSKIAKEEKADTWERREAEKNMYIWRVGASGLEAKPEKGRLMNPVPLKAFGIN